MTVTFPAVGGAACDVAFWAGVMLHMMGAGVVVGLVVRWLDWRGPS